MRRPSTTPVLLALSLFASVVLSGCETIEQSSLARMLPFGRKINLSPQETEQRQKFLNERDPDAFRWLLTHRIHNEMSVEQVAHVLGESGERRFDDREYKTNGGYYQTTDVGYQWGPDRKGHTVVLFFRDGKLINFDPAELQ